MADTMTIPYKPKCSKPFAIGHTLHLCNLYEGHAGPCDHSALHRPPINHRVLKFKNKGALR